MTFWVLFLLWLHVQKLNFIFLNFLISYSQMLCLDFYWQWCYIFVILVVSQIEHGVLQLVNVDDPRITVLMDCEGVSAFKFPMQMMRSCSILVQDHFPDRLGLMFVVRLPPVVRVIAHALIQVSSSTKQILRVCIMHIYGSFYEGKKWDQIRNCLKIMTYKLDHTYIQISLTFVSITYI